MQSVTDTDGRRAAGDRTRARLLKATKSLIALHGHDGISLRDITDAAKTNVAAVSYHFGSKDNLCSAAVEDAMDHVALGLFRAVTALRPHATVREISEAMLSEILVRKSSPDPDERALLAISARAILAGSDQATPTAASRELTEHLVTRMRSIMPRLKPDELRFRVEATASIMHVAAAGGYDAHTATFTRAKLMRWLVPILSGALSGAPS